MMVLDSGGPLVLSLDTGADSEGPLDDALDCGGPFVLPLNAGVDSERPR